MSKRPQESDVEFIRSLAEILNGSDLTEIKVNREYGEDDSLSVTVARKIPAPAAQATYSAPVEVRSSAPAASSPAPAKPAEEEAAADPSEDPGVVASPMVGTVYFQAEPGAAPFIKTGDTVSEGQTILIIEAMKTMNQVPAPRSGRVKRILVDDGSPVEFGAPLIILE
ncbi:acetyl-CoA carboxylase biotin carboxyl carrier protein [Amaricoccus tamworthensis]|uniref:acetyl-CoA carboxylase biotin carboxyl carrier protein n=1 Tax=Amaricoccus tamworthensis TaxID=57002 RepID=UPI003C7AE873